MWDREMSERGGAVKRPTERRGWIYFLKAGGLVKVGFSLGERAELRIRNLRMAMPCRLDVIAVVPGTFKEEQTIHRALRSVEGAHSHGEWYRPCRQIADFLRSLRTRRGASLPMTGGSNVDPGHDEVI